MNICIILVHNVRSRSEEILGMTDTCLRTLRETADQPYHLLLLDNGSDDDGKCFQFLQDHSSEAVLRSDTNQPVSAAWNAMMATCTESDNIILLNNDVIFNRKGWMSALTAPLSRPNVGAVGGHKMGWNGMEFLEGSYLAFNLGIAKQVAENGHIFDEQFEFTCEEADFCQRLLRAGLTLEGIDIEDNGMVTHLHHGTLMWSNEDGGWNGQSILNVMHECRRKLCRKYGLEERVND